MVAGPASRPVVVVVVMNRDALRDGWRVGTAGVHPSPKGGIVEYHKIVQPLSVAYLAIGCCTRVAHPSGVRVCDPHHVRRHIVHLCGDAWAFGLDEDVATIFATYARKKLNINSDMSPCFEKNTLCVIVTTAPSTNGKKARKCRGDSS